VKTQDLDKRLVIFDPGNAIPLGIPQTLGNSQIALGRATLLN